MYNGSKASPYWYSHGFNWRIYVAWSAGFAISIHGVAASFQSGYNLASKHMYNLSLELATLTAAIFYYVICKIWPVAVYPPGREGESMAFEILGKTDGFFEDESEPTVIEGVESGMPDPDSKSLPPKEFGL